MLAVALAPDTVTISPSFPAGKTYTMIGKDGSAQGLGVAPCAISWLFKLISERKEKTGTRFSLRVSAVEISGRDEQLTDLLAEVSSGSLQDGQSPGVYLREDPIYGTQVRGCGLRLGGVASGEGVWPQVKGCGLR